MSSEVIDLPPGSDELSLVLIPPQTGRPVSAEVEFTPEDYKTAMRMLVGAALEGSDELRRRLKIWLVNIQRGEQGIDASILEQMTGGSQLRYILIGLLFKTPEYLSWGAAAAGRASSRVFSFVSTFTRPITRSRVMRPVRRRYDDLVKRGRYEVRSLLESGRSEESYSRTLIHQHVSDETIEELLTYLVEKSKIRQVIQETAVTVGDDALVEMRGRGAAVDSSLDNLVKNILRREKHQTPPSDSLS